MARAHRTPAAGELDTRVTFLRRPPITARAGNERADSYAPVFACWAGFQPLAAHERTAYGLPEDIETGWLTVREQPELAEVTNADRVRFLFGDEFAVRSVPQADRTGARRLRIERKMG